MDRESPGFYLTLPPSLPPVVLRALSGSRGGAAERTVLGTDILALGEVIGTVLGIVILAAVGIAVGVTVAKNHSSSSSSTRSGSSSSSVNQTDPNDPSTFEKDSRLVKSFWGIAYTPEGSQYPDCGNRLGTYTATPFLHRLQAHRARSRNRVRRGRHYGHPGTCARRCES